MTRERALKLAAKVNANTDKTHVYAFSKNNRHFAVMTVTEAMRLGFKAKDAVQGSVLDRASAAGVG